MSKNDFSGAYAVTPLWDIGRPQPALHALAEAGELRGRVLDSGCGTGEHALMAAALGLDARGIDSASPAIQQAEAKAAARNLPVRFMLVDVLELSALGERFDTVLDAGCFHTFDDDDRRAYVESLKAAFEDGWRVDTIEPAVFETNIQDRDAQAWLASIARR